MLMMKKLSVLTLVFLFVAGCQTKTSKVANNNQNTDDSCIEGDRRCNMGATAVEICSGGEWETQDYCTEPTPHCHDGACVTCRPNTRYCDGEVIRDCSADGMVSTVVDSCDLEGGETCLGGECVSLCAQAEDQNSYIGCEYWPTTTANPFLDASFNNDFGVVVHNDNLVTAYVTITKAGSQVAQETIPAGELKVIQLAFDPTLRGSRNGGVNSALVDGGAHHLVSSVPVTVYQFNPLNYKLDVACQEEMFSTAPCYSYTNDASLLLPAHVLSTNYMVMSWPTTGAQQRVQGIPGPLNLNPGFVTIAAIEDNTTVTVNFTANTSAGNNVGGYSPGSTDQFTLNRGQVLQIMSDTPSSCTGTTAEDADCQGRDGSCTYCNMETDYDLTGTRIQSSAPVAVFGGHVCTFIPFNKWACDHLEHQMIPSETWGKEFIVARTEPQWPADPEPNVIKIMSRENNNTISFHPSGVHSQVNLNAGQYVEFETTEDFHVTATEPTMVAQYTVGQNYYTLDKDYHGDPAFAIVVPFEQYRYSYTFLVPETMSYNFVNIVAQIGTGGGGDPSIYLNGDPVSFANASPIGASGYGVVRIDLTDHPTNHHTVTGAQPFGIMVYGFARYTSYFYPGGMNLEYISPVL